MGEGKKRGGSSESQRGTWRTPVAKEEHGGACYSRCVHAHPLLLPVAGLLTGTCSTLYFPSRLKGWKKSTEGVEEGEATVSVK